MRILFGNVNMYLRHCLPTEVHQWNNFSQFLVLYFKGIDKTDRISSLNLQFQTSDCSENLHCVTTSSLC